MSVNPSVLLLHADQCHEALIGRRMRGRMGLQCFLAGITAIN